MKDFLTVTCLIVLYFSVSVARDRLLDTYKTKEEYRKANPAKPLTDPNGIIWRTDICEVNYDRERRTTKTS